MNNKNEGYVSEYVLEVCFGVCFVGVFPGMFQGFSGFVAPKSNFPALVKVEHAQKSADHYRPKFALLVNTYEYNLNLKLYDPEKHEARQCQVTFLQVRITKRTSISMAGGFRSSDAFRLQRFSRAINWFSNLQREWSCDTLSV